jgi:cytochrome d ubiquinol oxidase subunit I
VDTALLSRIQFGLTAGFHFIFPPLTIGLAWLIVFMKTMYLKTGNEDYWKISRFWVKIFAIGFVVGVATGIPMEFQFGTNWSAYSRYVGDVFGAPLAAEVIFTFFLESGFLALLVFGTGRVSKKVQWFAALMVAVGSTMSAFWIIVASSWMQTPAGYEIVNGRAQLTDFMAAVFNPSTLNRYTHTLTAAFVSGSFFMMGLSAWFLLKGKHIEFAKKSLKVSLIAAAVFSIIQIPIGHLHTVQVANTQPMKLAAFEGLYKTTKGAPLCLIGLPNAATQTISPPKIEIPNMLSYLIYGDFNAEVKGLDCVPEDERPPEMATFLTFRGMVGLGTYMLLLTLAGIALLMKGTLYENRTFLTLALFSIPVPLVANELGWVSAEVGRQPWIVQGLMKTQQAFSPVVPAGQVALSIFLFLAVYTLLFSMWIFLLRRELAHGPEALLGEAPAVHVPHGTHAIAGGAASVRRDV